MKNSTASPPSQKIYLDDLDGPTQIEKDQRIPDLECEIHALKDCNATQNRKMEERNNEISRLKVENNELKRKLEFDLEQQPKSTISVRYNVTVMY